MLRWDPAEDEAADALPWDMPMAHAMRPLSMRLIRQLIITGGLLFGLGGLVGIALVGIADVTTLLEHATLNLALSWFGVIVATGYIVGAVALPSRLLRTIFPVVFLLSAATSSVIVSIGVYGAGPDFGDITAVFYLEAPLFAFYVCRLPWALASLTLTVTAYATVLVLQDGWPFPPGRWIVVACTVGATAYIMGRAAQRAEQLADSEHEARVELAELNHTLEDRVATQVGEIERLGELRRFLSPQVADAVLSTDADTVTRPHRARIAVFFCDLRGFTAFTRDSEPEEVIAITDEYYRAVGTLLQSYGATIGGYAGDGIMAYLGDPVPHDEPAKAAVQLSVELRGVMATLEAEWRRRGFDLSYGVGLAYGYATLGVVGFDGRFDYTPLGGVVNLAARLCSKATAAQVLIDHATYVELDGAFLCQPIEGLELKGLGAQRAYALT